MSLVPTCTFSILTSVNTRAWNNSVKMFGLGEEKSA